MTTGSQPVLILGAGINGCAIARELLLNGVSAWIVDTADLASGATSGSSRLIHGGLRYLEFGDFELVKESLEERGRLLRLAPQFVHPLRLSIPVASRFGGVLAAPGRFMGWRWWPAPQPKHGRGVVLVRAGLKMYDLYAHDRSLPAHSVERTSAVRLPAVDRHTYRWLCSYYDGQVTFPERLVLSMLDDARHLAATAGLEFQLLNYRQATLVGETVEIRAFGDSEVQQTIRPTVVVNATGAWVDHTLERLEVPSARLMGGTKGTHFFTFSPRLREALGTQGVYAEASDGRPIFIVPLDRAVLVGTTDEKFDGLPSDALATERELEYLRTSVNAIFPQVKLTEADINFHYSAVRPLPYTDAATPAAISRRHALVRNEAAKVPLFSVVGGKLTTMRSLAEMTAHAVLGQLGREVTANSRERSFPGAEDYPQDQAALEVRWRQIADGRGLPVDSVAAVWKLVGTRTEAILSTSSDNELLGETELPCSFARWSIEHEWSQTLADLIERRLMLLYHQRLTRSCLRRLAELLAAGGRLPVDQIEAAVAHEADRLASRYGKKLA